MDQNVTEQTYFSHGQHLFKVNNNKTSCKSEINRPTPIH